MNCYAFRKIASKIQCNYDIVILVVFAMLLYLPLMSCSYDEWDSYNFALSLTDYDIPRHRPHPPGYPLYVFFGRIALHLVGNPLTALTVTSAVSGALTAAPVYALSRRMYDRRTAVLTSLATIFTPALWVVSESALADTFFTFLLVLAISLLYSGIKGSSKSLQVSWLVYGIAIGARPTPAALAPLLLWIPSTIFIARKIGGKTIIKAALLFLASCSAWFVPMIFAVGWDNYWLAMSRQYIGASTVDFVWARTHGLDPVGRLVHVITQILVFSLGGAFIGAEPLFASTNPAIYLHGAFLIVAIGMFIINLKGIAGKTFLFLWFAPYFAFVYTFGTLNYPRYYLPIIPAIMIPLVSSTLAVTRSIFRNRPIRLARSWIGPALQLCFPAVLIMSLFVNTLPLAMIIHHESAPTKQLFDYITANYPPGTIIIEYHEHRVFQFYLNKMQYLHSRLDQEKVIAELSHFSLERRLLITSSAYRHLARHPSIAELHVSTIVEFFRDPHVMIEDHRVRLYEIISVKLR